MDFYTPNKDRSYNQLLGIYNPVAQTGGFVIPQT